MLLVLCCLNSWFVLNKPQCNSAKLVLNNAFAMNLDHNPLFKKTRSLVAAFGSGKVKNLSR